VTWRSW